MNSLMQRVVSDLGVSQRLSIPSGGVHQPLYQPVASEQTDSNNNSGEGMVSDKQDSLPRRGEKYSLRPRSIQKRQETEQRSRVACKRSSRPKQKPPPLSKYRRKTANARERDRMREINAAFESLRRAVPHLSDPAACSGNNEKLTKITTLRLAMKYIAALSQALKAPEPELGDLLAPDLDCLLLGSDGDLSEHCLTPHSLPDLDESLSDPPLPDFCHPCLAPGFSEHCLTP